MSTGVVSPNDGNEPHRVNSKNDDVELEKSELATNPQVLGDDDLMNEAFQGENEEHEETLWGAVKTHPKACFWAFIMCFTIVSITLLYCPKTNGFTNTALGHGIL